MARSRSRRYRSIEIVYLPGDEELYADFMRRERRGRNYRNIPHDHTDWRARRRREQDSQDEYELMRLRDLIRRAKEIMQE